MSQNALHFSSDFQNNLKEFYSLLGKDGKGFESLNFIFMGHGGMTQSG